jgi:hypothetical protein
MEQGPDELGERPDERAEKLEEQTDKPMNEDSVPKVSGPGSRTLATPYPGGLRRVYGCGRRGENERFAGRMAG